MKSLWISFALSLLVLSLLTACSGQLMPGTNQADAGNTYPSQFLRGDVYVLKSQEKIAGNIVGIGTTLIIEEGAVVQGNINLLASDLQIKGRVAGDLNLVAGTSSLDKMTIVSGSVNQVLNPLHVEPGAVILGEINAFVLPAFADKLGEGVFNLLGWLKPGYWIALQFLRILALSLAALLAASLFREPSLNVMKITLRNKLAAWGVGILSLFFIPLISLVLITTICLSPVGLFGLILLWVSSIWGWAVLCQIIGKQLTTWLKLAWSVEGIAVFGAVVTGILMSLISIVPFMGWVINTLVGAIGLGGVLTSRFGKSAS